MYSIGSHIESIEDIPKNANIIQLFKNEKIINTKNKNIINKVVHASYSINLANSWDEYSWWIDLLIDEIIYAKNIDAQYIVVHLGKQLKLTKEEALNNMFTSLLYVHNETIHKARDVKILLETSTGQGSELCYLLEDFAYFYKKISTHNNFEFKNRFGLCVDTCHIFSAGYDITTTAKIKTFLKYFDDTIGIRYIKLIHLNDSKKELGAMVDRHANIGSGFIGKKALACFAKYFIKLNIPIILETPKQCHEKEINYLTKTIENI